MKRKFMIKIEIEVDEKFVDPNKVMFQLTQAVNQDLRLDMLFPELEWDDKKFEVMIKDLNP